MTATRAQLLFRYRLSIIDYRLSMAIIDGDLHFGSIALRSSSPFGERATTNDD